MLVWALMLACWVPDALDQIGGPATTSCADGGPPVMWYRDGDDDGYGNDAESFTACDPPMGYTSAGGDCDETDPGVNPSTPEECNGLDDDCDFQVDEGGATWCNDVDLDGYGDPNDVIHACERPAGYVPSCDDCNDGDLTVFPGAPELSDGQDNDCDDAVDE